MDQYIGLEIGGYRIVEPIGMGGMARVFKTYQPGMDRIVALKVLPDYYAQDETYLERFRREARIIARLEHKHILPVFDFGQDNGTTYLAMRYVRGGSLKDVINQCGGQVPTVEAARLLGQVASALGYAHEQGIVHRDVKPSNVLVDADGDCYLMDFGIAKVLEATSHLTRTGSAIGTPTYMSPEQGMGKLVDGRSDVYSLGIMLYEMVTGRVPFNAETPMAVVLMHERDPLPLPRQLKPDLSEEIEQVIFKALAKSPEDRYQSAGEFAAALDWAAQIGVSRTPTVEVNLGIVQQVSTQLAADKPTGDVTPEVRRLARKQRSKRWLVPAALGVSLLVIAGLVITLLTVINRPVETADEPTSLLMGQTQRITPTRDTDEPSLSTENNDDAEPAAKPVPTLTSTPAFLEGVLLFEDDFQSRTLDQWQMYSVGWELVQTANGDIMLHGSSPADVGNNIPHIQAGSMDWTNYIFEFRVRVLEQATEMPVQVGVRVTDDEIGCWRTGVEFSANRDMGFAMQTFRGGDETNCPYIGLASAYDPVLALGEWYDIRIVALDNRFTTYLDGVKVMEAIDPDPVTHGRIYLVVHPGVTADFDDVRVTQIVER